VAATDRSALERSWEQVLHDARRSCDLDGLAYPELAVPLEQQIESTRAAQAEMPLGAAGVAAYDLVRHELAELKAVRTLACQIEKRQHGDDRPCPPGCLHVSAN
jgi:hypothetical protein